MAVWDRATGQEAYHGSGISLRIRPRQPHIGDDRGSTTARSKVIDTEAGSELWKVELGWGQTRGGLAFSPDGNTIVTEQSGRAQVL